METFTQIMGYVLPHLPFLVVTLVLTVVGQFTSKRLFTRERAYAKGKLQWFWWWGRESLPLHPIVTGGIVGAAALNWELAASGVVSLFAWAFIKGWAKKKGIELQLPGDSVPPPDDDPEKTPVEGTKLK